MKVAGDGTCYSVKSVKLVIIYTLTLGTRIKYRVYSKKVENSNANHYSACFL